MTTHGQPQCTEAEFYVSRVVPATRKHKPKVHADRWCVALLRGRGGGPGYPTQPGYVEHPTTERCTLCGGDR